MNKEKTALITGGSKGIGADVARKFAANGYRIWIWDVIAPPVELLYELDAANGSCMHAQVDVSNEAEVMQAAAAVIGQWGGLDVLVNNAGIYPRQTALDIPYSIWQQTLAVNVGGTFLCSRAFAPGMLERGSGAIVNIASSVAFLPTPRGSHYAASKAAILSLTKSLAKEWAPSIRVNAVSPGVTDTDQPREGVSSDAELYARGKEIPLGRIGDPSDVAEAVFFLAGDGASYITGANMHVNGGALMA